MNVINTHLKGFDIGCDQFFLACKLFCEQAFKYFEINIQQGSKCAYVNDIFKQLTLTRISKCIITHFHQRNRDVVNVLPDVLRMQRLGTVVKKIPACSDIAHISKHALGIYTNHDIDSFPATQVSFFAYPNLIPGR